MSTVTLKTPPQVTAAREVLAKLDMMAVGEVATFSPPLNELVTATLFMLLRDVDKEWRILPPLEPKQLGWWKRLKAHANAPVDMGGRLIPRTISEIQRTR